MPIAISLPLVLPGVERWDSVSVHHEAVWITAKDQIPPRLLDPGVSSTGRSDGSSGGL